MSMYETGYSPKHYPHRAETGRHEDGVILQPFPSNVSRGSPPPPTPCGACPGGAGTEWVVHLNWKDLEEWDS